MTKPYKSKKALPKNFKQQISIQKQRKFYIAISLLLISAYAWIGWHWQVGSQSMQLSVCLSRRLLGIACPGCGTTRGVLAALRGDWMLALYYNPFSVLAIIGLVVVSLFLVYDLMKKDTLTYRLYRAMERLLHKPLFLLVITSLIALNWFWNIQKGI
jgi:hypothetical protein